MSAPVLSVGSTVNFIRNRCEAARENRLVELYPRGRQVVNDRDHLRAELQFYIDITEALEYVPNRITPEERAEANRRARNWIENIGRRRNNRG